MTTERSTKAQPAPAGMTIGRLAKSAGVTVETVRYYERCGLLPRPRRSGRAYRRYPPDMAQRIGFIKRVQSLGFSLEQIRALLDLDGAAGKGTGLTADYLLREVQRRVGDLRVLEAALKLRSRPRAGRTSSIVATLEPWANPKANPAPARTDPKA